MRRGTKLLLLLGCAFVLALEAPRSLSAFAAGWNGPYAGSAAEPDAFAARPDARAVEGLELARR